MRLVGLIPTILMVNIDVSYIVNEFKLACRRTGTVTLGITMFLNIARIMVARFLMEISSCPTKLFVMIVEIIDQCYVQ